MSGYNQDPRYGGQPETYWGDQTQQASSINFDMSGNNFGQELDFQSFDAQPPPEGSYTGAPLYGSNPYLNPSGGVSGYHGDIFTPPSSSNAQPGFVEKGGEFEEEPPLLEGLEAAKELKDYENSAPPTTPPSETLLWSPRDKIESTYSSPPRPITLPLNAPPTPFFPYQPKPRPAFPRPYLEVDYTKLLKIGPRRTNSRFLNDSKLQAKLLSLGSDTYPLSPT
uniref:Uncharacterized protein n=1 Tax=Timema genevievae TaxID=629358 RepID=A0A7R9K6J5_TIMGE|nr:unnamed protein product [Timema genevievae]